MKPIQDFGNYKTSENRVGKQHDMSKGVYKTDGLHLGKGVMAYLICSRGHTYINELYDTKPHARVVT